MQRGFLIKITYICNVPTPTALMFLLLFTRFHVRRVFLFVKYLQKKHFTYNKLLYLPITKTNIMENNQENFEAFVAQYWGQKVLTSENFIPGDCISVAFHNQLFRNISFDGEYHLLLREVSAAMPQELLHIAKMLDCKMSGAQAMYYAQTFLIHFKNKSLDGLFRGLMISRVIDYLRRTGFAVEWNGFDVETQIKYGWIKIKEVE